MDIKQVAHPSSIPQVALTHTARAPSMAVLDPKTKISKPRLSPSFTADITPPAIIFSRMMDNMQQYVMSTAEATDLKQQNLNSKLVKTHRTLRKEEAFLLDTKKTLETWEGRKKISNYLFHGVSLLTGTVLVASGQPWAGGSLITSSVGSVSSDILKSYGFDSSLTAAISMMSGVIGVVGSLGSGAYNLWYNPQATMAALQSNTFTSMMKIAAPLTSFFANGFTHYANYERNKNSEKLSQFEALHTKTNTSLRLLDQKHTSAAAEFPSKAKNVATVFRELARAQKRYTDRVMRVLTRDFV